MMFHLIFSQSIRSRERNLLKRFISIDITLLHFNVKRKYYFYEHLYSTLLLLLLHHSLYDSWVELFRFNKEDDVIDAR